MKIVLINVHTSYIMSIPFGITYLAAVLRRQGHKMQLFDIYPDDNIDNIINTLGSLFKPDLIGFSILSTNFHRIKSIIKKLREIFPQTKYCAGGIHPTVRPKETLEELYLDFIVIGEGENVLLKACTALENSDDLSNLKGIAYKTPTGIHINTELDIVMDLNTLPFPARDLLPVSRYLIPPGYIRSHFLTRVMSILTSRGCPFKCTFCNSSSIFHNRIRRRSIENVMAEINELIALYNIDGIYFHDETFTVNKKWLTELCDELKPLKLTWGCQTRVDLVNKDLLRIMKDAGCAQIDFGLETASDKMLKLLKKGITSEQAQYALKITKKNKIKSFASFMVGLPGENEEDIKKNIQFLKKNKPDFTYFNLYTSFPGTEATETAIKNGKLSADFFSRDYDMLLDTTPLVNLSEMSTETVIHYHKKLRNMVFWKNYFGVLSMHNLRFIFEAIILFVFSPRILFYSAYELLKTKNIEKFIFRIFSNYQKFKSKNPV